jgi:hypothetical protein
VGRRISHTSEDLCDQLINQLKTSSFLLQVDIETDAVEDVYLIANVRYMLQNYIREDFLFCRPTDGRATSLEVFNIINHFLQQTEQTGRTALDSALMEPVQYLDEMQNFTH